MCSRAKVRLKPASQPDIGNARGVVRMEMNEQQRINSTDWYADLKQPDRGASSGIDQQFLVAGLDQRARPETIGTRCGYAGPEQRDAEIARSDHCCIVILESFT